MKKTIVALMALAGVAMADDYTGGFAWAANTTPTFTFEGDVPLTMTDITCNKNYKALIAGDATVGKYNGTLTPDQNIGNGTGNSWTMTFTLTNTSDAALTLSQVTFDAFLFNGSGYAQKADADMPRPVSFTLAGVNGTVGSTTVAYANCQNEWDDNAVIAVDLTLAAGEAATYTLTVANAQTANNYGTFVGISGATFSTPAVPEPTTATLSLLALAGLAARRRRR